ncbi:radical SAM family heme chaperone HemW [Lentibacter algarum]|uniref:radical SAM family heme chaperone HemW n=1 Tax=Lentibacter algarum TaxID=576131 RepID=UPI001C07832E|nr:radical SAM family heme chaperone HemW [Lentibacter algarum]MBU2980323.1 radical SAM family heme chaperone HemW [Lentibacter algarum]
MSSDWENGGFGVYIHWPFCESKCPYCDFNSFVSAKIDHARWRAAYLLEIERYAAQLSGRVVSSVFFGGGTPSLMEPETVAAVVDKIRATWACANDLEVTLEANPSSVEAGRFAAFKSAGVTRISMGIQALNNRDLQNLGRLHTVDEAYAAFDIARNVFNRVSFDLIYARQGQAPDDWRKELHEATQLAVDHLSLYQLTIEQGTAFGDRYNIGKLRGLPSDDDAAKMYDITQEVCESAGFELYEVSNHAKPGSECRHNLVYWNYGDYLGIGPGAHGRLTVLNQRLATESFLQPNAWLENAEQASGEKLREPLSSNDQATEMLLMGLRLERGISIPRWERLSGKPFGKPALNELLELGMIKISDDQLQVTERGRVLLNSVLQKLLHV